ncbi:MAG: TIGR03790 family protein, partial [Acidobacteria bacterium]|nr:TIGR03790 family protein [Candidatus Polarisedimenticola svalbardensis]
QLVIPVILFFVSIASAQFRDDVMIVVNDNSLDSPQVGQYFADQRQIDPANTCHVNVPAGYFITWDEFRSLRDQIIDCMQQDTIGGMTPATCADGDPPYYCQASVDQLRENTSIRYLVTTRGVPTRMVVDGSSLSSPSAPTSVDNYLKYWLVRYFASDVTLNFTQRRNAFGDGRSMRTVDTAFDGELIVSRLEGVDLASAKTLVDRAIDAEGRGIYGKLYGSKYGNIGGKAQWRDYAANSYVYGDLTTGWRYQLGLFGESRAECIDYLDQPASNASGKAPDTCLARMTSGDDPPPGRSSSREPNPFDAMFWLGSLDGQPTIGSFNDFMNWRKDESCAVTLCRNAPDPGACRAASTDAFREINTDCMGVADGFWGYNFQSFPVSYFTAWPTAWYHNSGDSFTSLGGGDNNRLAFPDVRDDFGRTDSTSLWFGNRDQVAEPLCFAGADFAGPPDVSCPDVERMMINQRIYLPQQAVNEADPQQYRIGLWYRSADLASRTLRARFWVREVGGGATALNYGTLNFATVAGDNDWTYAEVIFTLDPAVHTHADKLYDGIRVRLEMSNTHAGEIGIDDVTIQEVGSGVELAVNRSFDQGHEQVSAGDHASNFLSRLNGTAFFGSLSHHQSGGHSFDQHPMETLLYFLRGLPLGDAVWWAENYNSGVLYGDPLYSPTSVMLHYLNDQDRVLDDMQALLGNTVNGRDPARVDTLFEVDYCPGSDFFDCDAAGSWVPTALAGGGGLVDQPLGNWDVTTLPYGQYTIRLKVISTDLATGRNQALFDYYPVTVGYPLPEVSGLLVDGNDPTTLTWDDQTMVLYDIAGGMISDLGNDQGYAQSVCLHTNNVRNEYFDQRTPPGSGDAYYYLVRAKAAGAGSYGNAKTDGPDPRNELDLANLCP